MEGQDRGYEGAGRHRESWIWLEGKKEEHLDEYFIGSSAPV